MVPSVIIYSSSDSISISMVNASLGTLQLDYEQTDSNVSRQSMGAHTFPFTAKLERRRMESGER